MYFYKQVLFLNILKTNKLDLAKLPSTATNAYNLKCSQLLSMKVWVSRLCYRMQAFAQLYMGESQLLTRLVLLNTIPIAITVTITQKILISQRKHPSSRSWFCQHLGIFPVGPSVCIAQSRPNGSEHMAGTSHLGGLKLINTWEHTVGVGGILAQRNLVCLQSWGSWENYLKSS